MVDYQREYFQKCLREVRTFVKTRQKKASKIVDVLLDSNVDLKRGIVLDIGCSTGIITHQLGKFVRMVVGVDIDPCVKRAVGDSSDHFMRADGLNLPFRNSRFNIVICNHVIEHVPDKKKLCAEIYRVLEDGGLCYLATGNKFVIFEGHYGLPFPSWLPQNLADAYLRIAGRGKHYYEKMPTYWELKALLSSFEVNDMTPWIAHRPERFSITNEIPRVLRPLLKHFPVKLLQILSPIMPTWILLIRKHEKTS